MALMGYKTCLERFAVAAFCFPSGGYNPFRRMLSVLGRTVLAMLSPEDRRIALDFMELLSWQKVAARSGMSEGTFRRHVLAGFVSRFKEAWGKFS